MKKKIFLVLASLGTGGSERVYWMLSQYFSDENYDVSLVLLDSHTAGFSPPRGVRLIDLDTIKASRSLFKLHRLFKKEKPFAVFTTTDHINILAAMAAGFLKIPRLIARASNNPEEMKLYYGFKARFYNLFTRLLFVRFDTVVCQSLEMKRSMARLYGIAQKKLIVVPNPVLPSPYVKENETGNKQYRMIIVARLSKEKGLFRILEIMRMLPADYVLTIAGDGPMIAELKAFAGNCELKSRVTFLGKIKNVPGEIVKHDLLVLASFTEGFPNVVLEALAVGVPAVCFRVGGINEIIREGFNGFVARQNDLLDFRNKIIRARSLQWQHGLIKKDTISRFALDKIGRAYERLITDHE